MDWLNRFLEWYIDRKARRSGKGCARVMLIAFSVMWETYKGNAPTYAWVARKALTTRPYWRQVDERRFVYRGGNAVIDVPDDLSLLDVVLLVLDVEMNWATNRLPPWRREELVLLAQEEAIKYLKGKAE